MVPPTLGVALAHPLTEPFQLPLSPLAAATAGAALVFLVAMAVPRKADSSEEEVRPVTSWAGSLTPAQVVTRALAVALLALAVAAGRLGADEELDNLAPALVVGVLWPLLALVSVAAGPIWRWVDPWDGIARVLTRERAPAGAGAVWPAVLPAIGWAWYLGAYNDTLDPRAVGAALAVYTLFTLAGSVALGRARWLSSAEPFGILLSWLALFPRRRLASWRPPRGADVLLGVFIGGILFGAVRRSELWGGLNTAGLAELYAALGVLLFSAAAAGLLVLLRLTLEPLGARSAAAQSVLPAVAGIVIAVALDRNRLTTSVQLLPELFSDPFGRGWALFGVERVQLDPAPLGTEGLLWAQLGVLLAGFLAGAVVLARRLGRGDRPPSALLLAVLASAAVIAVVTH